ncbi:tripartite-type tricarboxylate transporter receptor subunit TctC [Variovorax boronicumulans]|uniref:Bug family tripartite tricarboxylate transporter substrate binding protein n=1 Tax=Variovorax boronicumulans TaxID=436515 RepID=UPI0027876B04|nr:tripartite tricarboxylate transporter substrate binding protein [Variovorax boronicumulans]MDP9993644.1 tripartite-type tricarboxylate transporter receptor subunit TctC [Variovorax boronicumulans]MDQ0004945.1 tripartite-type tricarboxylate transporter receptor subunit TctC [Variovorax boronicumulans]
MKRRLLLAGALLAAGAALAQGSPRPLKIVVPFGAGTSTDIVGRILADALGRQLGVAAIVENKPGAGGSIGSEQVARSNDGQTLLMGTVGTHAINPSLYKRLPYQPLRDFVPLGFAGATPTLLVVPANSPWKSVADMRAATGNVNFASAGNGTSGHLAGELLNVRLAKNFMHVPYRDGAQAMTELMAGNVQFMFYHPAAVMPQVRAGKLRALGASGAKRSAAAPDVPTLMEQGVKDFDLVAWFMLYAPTSMPAAQRDRLREATRQVLAQPEVREKLAQQGIEHAEMNTEQLDAFARTEIAKWGEAVRRSGAQID